MSQRQVAVGGELESNSHAVNFICEPGIPSIILVPWEPDDPGPHQVYMAMDPGIPYTAGELAEEFDVTRHTIYKRLDKLVEMGEVRKKEHAENRYTYWVPK